MKRSRSSPAAPPASATWPRPRGAGGRGAPRARAQVPVVDTGARLHARSRGSRHLARRRSGAAARRTRRTCCELGARAAARRPRQPERRPRRRRPLSGAARRPGEDGTLQALLDVVGVPYTGSGALGSALAMDKDVAKRLFRAGGVATADWLMAPATAEEAGARLGWPCRREAQQAGLHGRPLRGGRPGGVRRRRRRGVPARRRGDDRAFVPAASSPWASSTTPRSPWARSSRSTSSSTTSASTPRACRRRSFLPPFRRSAAEAQRLAVLAHAALKLAGYSRIDFRLEPSGELWCLEVNTLPGMTATSLLPQSAAAAGIAFAHSANGSVTWRCCNLAPRDAPDECSHRSAASLRGLVACWRSTRSCCCCSRRSSPPGASPSCCVRPRRRRSASRGPSSLTCSCTVACSTSPGIRWHSSSSGRSWNGASGRAAS